MSAANQEQLLEKILKQLQSMDVNSSNNAKSKASSLGNTNKSKGYISNMIENNVKKSKEYLEIQKKILREEDKMVKLKSKSGKEETISDRLARNLLKIETLKRAGHDKMAKQIEKENKALLQQERRQNKIKKLQEEQGKLQEKELKRNKLLIKLGDSAENIRDTYKKLSNSAPIVGATNLIKGQLNELTGLNGGILGFLEQTLSNLWEQDSVISKLSANYALSRKETNQLKINITKAAIQTSLIGVKTVDLVKMQQAYTDEIGRSVQLTEAGFVGLSEMGVATGLGIEGAAQMAASMEEFGFGAERSVDLIEKLMLRSKSVGVSNSVSATKFKENLKIANSYTFKNGLKGVLDMTAYSTRFRINMQSISSFADKISNPEGAIQTAASLQVLGGAFANLADPMNLLNQGITDMEGLTKTYSNMLDGIAQIDKKTGEISINGYDRLRLKAAAEATNINFDEMMTVARTKAKYNAIESTFKLNPIINTSDEETKQIIASLAQYEEGKGFQINIGGKAVQLSKLSKEDINALQPKDDSLNLKTVAENTLGISDIIKNVIAASMQRLVNELMPSLIHATDYLVNIVSSIENFITGKSSIGGALPNSYGNGAGAIGGSIAGLGLGAKSARLLKAGGGLKGFGANVKTALGVSTKMGSKIPLIGSLLAGGGEYLSSGSVSRSVGAGLGNAAGGLAGAAVGAAIGSVVPIIGTAIGGLVGGIVGSYGGSELGAYAGGFIENANDVIIPKNGRPIKLNSQDDVFAMKQGGAIQEAIKPSLDVRKTFGGVIPSFVGSNGLRGQGNGKLELSISGSINLVGGNNSTKISANELIKDKNFLRELTRMIGNQMNRDKNGGKFQGGLNNNSF